MGGRTSVVSSDTLFQKIKIKIFFWKFIFFRIHINIWSLNRCWLSKCLKQSNIYNHKYLLLVLLVFSLFVSHKNMFCHNKLQQQQQQQLNEIKFSLNSRLFHKQDHNHGQPPSAIHIFFLSLFIEIPWIVWYIKC